MSGGQSAENDAACICPYTPPETWLSAASCGYGGGYEPGSMQEWNPDCPAHPPVSCLCPDPLRAFHPGCQLHGHSPDAFTRPIPPASSEVDR